MVNIAKQTHYSSTGISIILNAFVTYWRQLQKQKSVNTNTPEELFALLNNNFTFFEKVSSNVQNPSL